MRQAPRIFQLVVIVAGMGLALIPMPAAFIDQYYSNGLYPIIATALAPLANAIPFTLGDVLLLALFLGLVIWWIVRLVRAGRGRRLKALAWLLLDTLSVAFGVYILFLALWGLNYQREPLTSQLDYDPQRVTTAAAHTLALLTIQHLNADVDAAHRLTTPTDAQIRQWLAPSFDTTLQNLGNRTHLGLALPKYSLLDPYFEATSVTGFTDPFTHEVTLTASLLPFEKPFVLAHESSHVAGYASEAEANFIALLTCIRSNQPFIRYSGWLALYSYLAPAPGDTPPLAPQVKRDLRAITERILTHQIKRVSETEQKAYDNFLKANRVEGGIGNYGLFVQLVLGTHFAGNWKPLQRTLTPLPPFTFYSQSF